MKIAYFLPSLANKGPVTVAKDLVSFLKDVADITVFYFDPIVETHFECPTIRINLFDKIDLSGFDILHSHMLRPDAFLYLNRNRSKAKLVTTLHNYVEPDLKNTHNRVLSFIFTRVWKQLLSKHDMLVALSSDMKKYYLDLYGNKNLTYIYNGRNVNCNGSELISPTDLNEIKAFKGDALMLGVSAQLTERKGIDQLLKLLSTMSELKLLVIGDGPAKEDLLMQASRLNVLDRCLFLGYRQEAYRYNSLFDIYAMTSRSEGFPLAMIEAAAYGVPILASDLPVFKEAFTNEEVSFYQLENIDSMQLAVEKLIANKITYSKNILAKYLADYTAKEMASNYFQLYKHLLSEA